MTDILWPLTARRISCRLPPVAAATAGGLLCLTPSLLLPQEERCDWPAAYAAYDAARSHLQYCLDLLLPSCSPSLPPLVHDTCNALLVTYTMRMEVRKAQLSSGFASG